MNLRVLKLIQVYASHSPSILEDNKNLEVQILYVKQKLPLPNNKRIEDKKVQHPLKVI